MFNTLKNLFKPAEAKPHWTETGPRPEVEDLPAVAPKVRAKRGTRPTKKAVQEVDIRLLAKEKATAAGEPYVAILSVDVDPENINNGSFELDWNDKFLLNLIKSGYKMKEDDKDSDIVDRWFHTICRNVVLEVYEQEMADPENRDPGLDTRIVNRRPLGDGRSEIS